MAALAARQMSGSASVSASGSRELLAAPGADSTSSLDGRRALRSQTLSLANLSALDHQNGEVESPTSVRTTSRGRMSRTASVVSYVSSNRGSTTRLSSLWDSRLSLVAESRPAETQAGRPLEALEEKSSAEESGPYLPTRAMTLDQDALDRLSVTACRRRSMFTPGVATRGRASRVLFEGLSEPGRPAASDDGIPDGPAIKAARRSTLAALQSPYDAGISATTVQRASTPTGLEHRQLGCLVRGSLHVTNGATSPTRSVQSGVQPPSGVDDAGFRDGYLSHVAAERGERAAPRRLAGWRSKHVEKASTTDDDRATTVTTTEDARRSEGSGVAPCKGGAPGLPSDAADVAAPEGIAELAATSIEIIAKPGRSSEPEQLTVAEQYLAQLPPAPFLGDVCVSNWRADGPIIFEPEEYVFEDEGVATSPDRSCDQLARYDAAGRMASAYTDSVADSNALHVGAIWPRRMPSAELHFGGSKPSSTAGRQPSQDESAKESQTNLSKSDSGYSSRTSLRSLHVDQPLGSASEQRVALTRQTSSVYTRDTYCRPYHPEVPAKLPPPPPPKETGPRRSIGASQAPPVPPKPTPRRSQTDQRFVVEASVQPTREPEHRPEPPAKDVDRRSRKSVDARRSFIDMRSRSRSPGGRRRLQKQIATASAKERGVAAQEEGPLLREDIPPVPSVTVTRLVESSNDGACSVGAVIAEMEGSPVSVTVAEMEGSPVGAAMAEMAGSSVEQLSLSGDSLMARVGSPDAENERRREMDADAFDAEQATKKRRRASIGEFMSSRLRRISSSIPSLNRQMEQATGQQAAFRKSLDAREAVSIDGGKAEQRPTSVDKVPEVRRVFKTKSMVEIPRLCEQEGSVDRVPKPRLTRPRSYCASEPSDEHQQHIRLRKAPHHPNSVVYDSSNHLIPPVPSVPAIHLMARGPRKKARVSSSDLSSPDNDGRRPQKSFPGTSRSEQGASSSSIPSIPSIPSISNVANERRGQRRHSGYKPSPSPLSSPLSSPSPSPSPQSPSQTTTTTPSSSSSPSPLPRTQSTSTAMPILKKRVTSPLANSSTPSHGRSFTQLQQLHGLDLRDVPISVGV